MTQVLRNPSGNEGIGVTRSVSINENGLVTSFRHKPVLSKILAAEQQGKMM